MKIKTKLIASIMSICLVCAVFAIGVFALKTANLKIGGDVSFNATGVEADIINAKLSGTVADEGEGIVLATGSINTSMTQADIDTKFQNWQTLELDFNENGDDIVFKFDIANTSANANNYIEIDYDYSFTTENPNVDVFPGDENDSDVWENNNYILTPKGSAEGATATYETFTLKFKVLDKELNVKDGTKVNLTISLKHTTPKTATATNNVVTIDNVKYTLNTSAGTASVTGQTIETAGFAAVIHPVVMSDAEGAVPCVVTSIGDFSECRKLASITIPNSVTSIGDCAFASTAGNSIGSIIIPNSVTSIGEEVFFNNLTTISIPNSVTSIEGYAFSYSNLTTITIPSGVKTIGDAAFFGCSDLTSIVVASGNSVYDSRNNCNAIIETASNTLISGCQNTIIPNGVTSIGSYAFSYSNLTTITIPSSVTSIGSNAFSNCTNLTSVKFEETTGWWYASSSTATSGTELTISETDFAANATLLKTTYNGKYWFRTVS